MIEDKTGRSNIKQNFGEPRGSKIAERKQRSNQKRRVKMKEHVMSILFRYETLACSFIATMSPHTPKRFLLMASGQNLNHKNRVIRPIIIGKIRLAVMRHNASFQPSMGISYTRIRFKPKRDHALRYAMSGAMPAPLLSSAATMGN
jgi:hypothetical protein